MRKKTEELSYHYVTPMTMGAHPEGAEMQFAMTLPEGDAELWLFEGEGERPRYRFSLPEEKRMGSVGGIRISLPKGTYTYLYHTQKGNRVDPCAREIVRCGKKQEERGVLRTFVDAKKKLTMMPPEKRILYKLHVRGFTMQKPRNRHPGTFWGLQEEIPYLQKLGINTLLLMPVYEFDDAGRNYWGYTGGRYYAPRRVYCATEDPNMEFAALIDALHAAGIACCLEFYFREQEDARVVTDILRHWLLHFHIDGFHLAGTGAWTAMVEADPLLKKTLLLLPFVKEILPGQGEPACKHRAIYNSSYRDRMRRFLIGDSNLQIEEAAEAQRENGSTFSAVHFFADQNGFTLSDMVTYEDRQNAANGEENRDGTETNYTWNCGCEGPTKKVSIRQLREQQLRNALLLLMTAQGIPLLYAGDEVCNDQEGNNNAWCQDNPLGWVTWRNTAKAGRMKNFVRQAIAFRKTHPVLHQTEPLRLVDYRSVGLPDLSYHCGVAWLQEDGHTKSAMGMLYCGAYAQITGEKEDDTIYLLYNMYRQEQTFALPDLPGVPVWRIKADTARAETFYPDGEEPLIDNAKSKEIMVAAHSILILLAGTERA